jgi:hypothetical protein
MIANRPDPAERTTRPATAPWLAMNCFGYSQNTGTMFSSINHKGISRIDFSQTDDAAIFGRWSRAGDVVAILAASV